VLANHQRGRTRRAAVNPQAPTLPRPGTHPSRDLGRTLRRRRRAIPRHPPWHSKNPILSRSRTATRNLREPGPALIHDLVGSPHASKTW
jgi:hypothetical protein